MTDLSFDPARLAVLSMDMQSGIVSVYANDRMGLITRAAKVLDGARRFGATVVHVKVGFRPGLPEVNPRNPLLGAVKTSEQHRRLFEGDSGAIDPALGPEEGDVVVTKSRVNAFVGTDLGLVLRAREIDTIVMFGIATSGVVLATLLHASDEDFRLYVVEDCCADADESVHACLMDKVFTRRATVVSSGDVVVAFDTRPS